MGNLLRHGIDMYRQTININDPSKQEAQQKQSAKNYLPDDQKPPEKLLKIGKIPVEPDDQKESKFRRVAKFFILIGSEQAAGILAELDPEQVNEITKEIAQIKTISREESDKIIAEFHHLFTTANLQPYRFKGFSSGGIETARRIIYAAKGPVKGEALLNRAVPESKANIFSFLDEFSPEQLVLILKTETDQTAALILARLPAKLSAGTLSKFPANRKSGILMRMAHQTDVLPEVLEQVSAALKERVRHVSGGAKDVEIDGMQTLAAILKQGDYSFGDRLINELEAEDPSIGKNLKEKLYTLEDVVNTVDRPIQEKLKSMTEREIAVLLKSRKAEFKEKIMSCVSSGRRKIVEEEIEVLGPVSKRDCDAAAKDFLAWFRLARERGEIILYSDEDVYL